MMRRIGTAGLGYGQIFLIIFGFLITSGLIFLFGVWVGRDVTERRLAQEERLVRAPIPPPPTPNEEAKHDVDQSFYEQWKEKAYQRLQETAAAASATAVPRPSAASSGQLPTPALETTRAAPAVPVAPAAAPTRTAIRVVEKPTAKPTPPVRAKTSDAGEEWADAGWTVQVNATTNPEQATGLARRLKAKGYDAYTVQAPLRGQTWYRVRVGRFSSREKAKELESRLKESEGLENAYIAPQ
jgi:cell division septation protein DedD